MKIFFLLFFFIPNLALSLTFKDGKQVDKKKEVSKNFEKNFEPLTGYQIEKKVLNLNLLTSSIINLAITSGGGVKLFSIGVDLISKLISKPSEIFLDVNSRRSDKLGIS